MMHDKFFHRITEILRGNTQLPIDEPHSEMETEVLYGVIALKHSMSRAQFIGYSFPTLQHLRGALVLPSIFLGGRGSLILRRSSIHYVPNTSESKPPLDGNALLGANVDPSIFRQYLKDLWNDCVCDVLAALDGDVINPFKRKFRICWFTPPGGEAIPFGAAGSSSESAMDHAISSSITSLAHLAPPSSRWRLRRRRFIAFQGYCHGLTYVESELSKIAKGTPIHQHPQSSICALLNTANSFNNFHFVGHGTRDTLYLSDQEVLTGAKIAEGVTVRPRGVVYISTCGHDEGRCGSLSVSDALLRVGFRAAIKPTARVQDEVAAKVADGYYREVRHRKDPAHALNITLNRLRTDPSLSVEQWASFVHCGGHTI